MRKNIMSAAVVGLLLLVIHTTPVQADSLIKAQVTCYCESGLTCTGSDKQDGIIASKREWLGYIAVVYKVNEDGGVGEYIGSFPIEDVGYGRPVGHGTKSEFEGRESAGTIETGLTFDFRKPTLDACFDFMIETYTGEGSTGSQVYIKVIKGEG